MKFEPSPRLKDVTAYSVPRPDGPIDLILDGNEGAVPDAALFETLAACGPEVLRNYPKPAGLETQLAALHGIPAERVLVTAGADEGLDRLMRALLSPEREILLPVPTFEMIERYVKLADGVLTKIPWAFGDPYPMKEIIRKIDYRTKIIAVISPNNPTGAAIGADELKKLSAAASRALILLDHAYVEFADEDLTALALTLPNVIVLRTLSKAWGFAGIRVGYALGPADVIGWMKAAGGPYPVSGPSLALAGAWMKTGLKTMAAFVNRIRGERGELEALLAGCGVTVYPSQANFVFGRFADAPGTQRALAQHGIAVRAFPGKESLADCLRITCPGDERGFSRLTKALKEVLCAAPS